MTLAPFAGRVGRAHRTLKEHPGDAVAETKLKAARRDLAAAQIERSIERALATAPPLSDEQVERISARLRGVDLGEADA